MVEMHFLTGDATEHDGDAINKVAFGDDIA